MTYDKETVHRLLTGYTRHTVLTLVYYLAQHDVEAEVYADAARIFQRAADDKASGKDPGTRIARVNGKMIEV